MRKISFIIANSLDNFIAREDDSVDWLKRSNEIKEFWTRLWTRFDTLLMGGGTYEFVEQEGMNWIAPKLTTYVFSRTLPTKGDEQVEIIDRDTIKFTRELKRQPGKDILLMGGGQLAQSFFNYQLIDEIGLIIQPVLLGSGVPLFPDVERQIDLELVESISFANGCVYVLYRTRY